jgi:hypothetical protein
MDAIRFFVYMISEGKLIFKIWKLLWHEVIIQPEQIFRE